MNIELRTPTALDLRELNEPTSSPFFMADGCLIDNTGVELLLGGVTVNALFQPYSEFENAWAIVEEVNVEKPADRETEPLEGFDVTHILFETPEQRAEIYTEDELEYEAWSTLAALAILKERQEAAVAAKTFGSGSWAPEPICSPTNATQSVLNPFAPLIAKLTDEQIATYADTHVPLPRFLDDVGIMSHEDVATHFNDYVSGVAA